jgi:hypothetical protein
MEHLGELARQCRLAVEDAGVKHLSGLDAFGQVPSSAQPALEVLQTLCGYASECLAYAKPRDASNGQRRSLAFEILAQAGGLIDLPEVVALARRSLRKVNGREVRGAFVFLREHYASRDQAPEDPIIEALLALSEATDSRTNASGALSVLVETGAMSESEALGRMDDWKDSHWGR